MPPSPEMNCPKKPDSWNQARDILSQAAYVVRDFRIIDRIIDFCNELLQKVQRFVAQLKR